jgi:hypothetical protein
LNFIGEALDEILVDNTIRGSEEGDVGDKVTLIVVEAVVPVVKIFGQAHFFSGPERSFGLLVHLPDLRRVNDTKKRYSNNEPRDTG